jgi:hypothetical protein
VQPACLDRTRDISQKLPAIGTELEQSCHDTWRFGRAHTTEGDMRW